MKILIQLKGASFTAEADKFAPLSANFKLHELANNAGDPKQAQFIISRDSLLFIECLQAFRERIARPIVVNSGYRQKAYNETIKGADPNSGHLYGLAADIRKPTGLTDSAAVWEWRSICEKRGIIGAINLYDTYYHLEIRSDFLYGAKAFAIRDRRAKNDRALYR